MFTCEGVTGRAVFHPADPITDADIAKLTRAIHDRVLRFLRKRGKLPPADAPADDPDLEPPSLLFTLGAAAVQGRIALGPKASGAPAAHAR